MRLFYSEDAVSDLRRLRQFIAEYDPRAAERIGDELLQRLAHIAAFPSMGRPVALAPDPERVRDAIFGNYIVRYSIHRESVIILKIWHHREARG